MSERAVLGRQSKILHAMVLGAVVSACTSLTGADDLEASTPSSPPVQSDAPTEPAPEGSPPPSNAPSSPANSADAGAGRQQPPLPTPTPTPRIPNNPIDCGLDLCEDATPFCCIPPSSMSGRGTCIGIGQTCAGAKLECKKADDCGAGDVCCAFPTNSIANTARCVPAAGCVEPLQQRLCEASSDCKAGETCSETSPIFHAEYCGR